MVAILIILAFLTAGAALFLPGTVFQQSTIMLGALFWLLLAAVAEIANTHKDIVGQLKAMHEARPPVTPSVVAPPLDTDEKYCPACGKTSKPRGGVCTNCGAVFPK
jgi:hypothetical protein